MDRDTLVFIAFCAFMLLLGVRVRQRFLERKKGKPDESSGKRAYSPEEGEVKRTGREKRVRFFMILQLVVLGGLMVYMIPALTRDLTGFAYVDKTNLFLRCLIFVFTIYIFILTYVKIFSKKDRAGKQKQ